MKLLSTTFIYTTLEPGRSEWTFTLPSSLLSTQDPHQHLRISLKKLVLRNDFPTIRQGRDSLTVNGTTYTIAKGSPTGLLLAKRLTQLLNSSHGITVTFDGWDGSLVFENAGQTTATLTPLDDFGKIIGMPFQVVLAPGDRFQTASINLAPPETLILRCPELSGSSIEIRNNAPAANTSILCLIGMDVPPYATKVYRDSESLYAHTLTQKSLNVIHLTLEDEYATPLLTNTPILAMFALETLSDDQGAHLATSLEATENLRMLLLQGDVLRQGA